MEQIIRPNWHAAIVHLPIALLLVGTLVELFSFLGWRRGGFRLAGRWMILLGAVAAVPAAFSGLYALKDVLPQGVAALDATDPVAAELVRDHVLMQSIAAGGAILLVTFWLSLVDIWRRRLGVLFKLGLAIVCGLILLGSWHGGEMVYTKSIGVADAPPLKFPTSMPTSFEQTEKLAVDAFVPEQVHVTGAGLALAMVAVVMGLSVRRAAEVDIDRVEDDPVSTHRIAAAFAADPASVAEQHTMIGDNEIIQPVVRHRPTPTRRFWLLTIVLLVLTAFGGLWTLADNMGTWKFEALREAIVTPIEQPDQPLPQLTRRYAHTVTGITLVVGSLLMGLLSLVAPKNKWLLLPLLAILTLAIAVQIWLGVLLVLDQPFGFVTRFN